jgi:hypothetical protein
MSNTSAGAASLCGADCGTTSTKSPSVHRKFDMFWPRFQFGKAVHAFGGETLNQNRRGD